jgi:hypothetical protein
MSGSSLGMKWMVRQATTGKSAGFSWTLERRYSRLAFVLAYTVHEKFMIAHGMHTAQ